MPSRYQKLEAPLKYLRRGGKLLHGFRGLKGESFMGLELQVVVHHDDENHHYWANVVQLPGCFAAGRTKEELLEALQEAVELYLEDEDLATVVDDQVEVTSYRLASDRGLVPA